MRSGRIRTRPFWDVYVYDVPREPRAYRKPRRAGERVPAGLLPCKHRMWAATYRYAKTLALRQHRTCRFLD